MSDHSHNDLESQIRSLKSELGDLDYELRRVKRELESEIRGKADQDHSHGDC